MAESVVSFALERLGDLLIQEANFLSGVKDHVEQLQTELKLMHSFLKDADKRQDEDERVGAWVSEIRETAYDAEDVVETFALRVASRRRGGIQNAIKRYACIIDEAAELHKIGSEIEAINTKISSLRTSLQTYGITPISEGEGSSSSHRSRTELHLRRSYSHVVEEHIVGLDKDVKDLVGKLVSEDEDEDEENYCGVVSIWGMGGLGKTTLAKQLYHHNEIRSHFDAFAWASISQQCQPRDVWEGILFKLLSPSKDERKEIKGLRDDEVPKKLSQVLLDQKCLVILDDIWEIDTWKSLSPAFPLGKGDSKMVLTTRNKEVAQHVDNGRGFLHEPHYLTDHESWELLKKKAFQGKPNPDFRTKTDMENLGREMVGKCGGLPLAIVVLGGVLATKHTLSEWDKVHENINSYLRRGKGHDVSKVLALSYQELPYQLKQCFLYLYYFSENFDIPTKKMVRIWVAEGIVSPMQYDVQGEEPLEDVAERYLCELMDRSMIQVGERGSTGRVKTCRLHHLMRELCFKKANQENFLKILSSEDGKKQMDSRRIHRLAFYLGEEPFRNFLEQKRTRYLRSLLLFGWGVFHRKDTQAVQSWFINFRLLKILDLEEYSFTGKLGSSIGNLMQLRYLSLKFSREINIPPSIGNLRWLQTLILRAAQKIWVPNVISKMEQLRHLYLPKMFEIIGGKLQLGNLRNLRTLQGFVSWNCEVKEMIQLINLEKLSITYSGSFKELEGILLPPNVALNNLRSLDIHITSEETIPGEIISSNGHLYKLSLRAGIEKLPEYFPPNLTKLILEDSRLREDPMPILENLPNLRILKLLWGAFLGKEIVCSSNGFPQLQTLLLKDLQFLEEWCVAENAMPNLSILTIYSCDGLKMIPDGLKFITTLRKLEIRGMPVDFENRLRPVNEGGGGEDLHKVQHVSSIIVEEW